MNLTEKAMNIKPLKNKYLKEKALKEKLTSYWSNQWRGSYNHELYLRIKDARNG